MDLLEAGPAPPDLLADKGFNGKAFAAELATQGTAVLVPPGKDQRAREWAEIPWPLVRRLRRAINWPVRAQKPREVGSAVP